MFVLNLIAKSKFIKLRQQAWLLLQQLGPTKSFSFSKLPGRGRATPIRKALKMWSKQSKPPIFFPKIHVSHQYPSGSRFSCSFAGEFQCRLKCLRERRDRNPHIIDIIQILDTYVTYVYTLGSRMSWCFFSSESLRLMCNSYICMIIIYTFCIGVCSIFANFSI